VNVLPRLLLTLGLAVAFTHTAVGAPACKPSGDPAVLPVYREAANAAGDALSGLLLGRYLEINPWCDAAMGTTGRGLQARALQSAASDADLALLALAVAPAADHPRLLATVRSAAYDNAYFALALAALPDTDATTRAGWIGVASRAKRYSPTFPRALRGLQARFVAVHSWPGTQGALPPEDVRNLAFALANALASATSIPTYKPLVDTCIGAKDTTLRTACLGVARLLQDPSGTLLDARVGVRLMEKLAGTDAERAAAVEERRRLRWLSTQVNAWQKTDPELRSIVGRRYIAAVLASGEMAAMRQSLRDRGVAVEPPAGWKAPEQAE
jgi:hypothetical protein